MLDPLTHPREHGFTSAAHVAQAVEAFYSSRHGNSVEPDEVAFALATFVRSLSSASSAYDRYKAGDAAALTEPQKHGLTLFVGRSGCVNCHHVDDGTFTDGAYHAGQLSPDAPRRLATQAIRAASMLPEQRYRMIAFDSDFADLGRFIVTLSPNDIGTFATPSLRNVAVTEPYMHDGHIADLREAVEREIYWRNEQGKRGSLTPSDIDNLVAFLQSLTSELPTTLSGALSPKIFATVRRSERHP